MTELWSEHQRTEWQTEYLSSTSPSLTQQVRTSDGIAFSRDEEKCVLEIFSHLKHKSGCRVRMHQVTILSPADVSILFSICFYAFKANFSQWVSRQSWNHFFNIRKYLSISGEAERRRVLFQVITFPRLVKNVKLQLEIRPGKTLINQLNHSNRTEIQTEMLNFQGLII